MTTDEELADLRKRFEERERQTLKEKRKTEMVVGFLSIFALCTVVYAMFERTQEMRIRLEAQAEKVLMKEQIVVEKQKSAACERNLQAVQPAKSLK